MNNTVNIADYMPIIEAAEHLNISRASVYDAIKRGALHDSYILGKRVVLRADVLVYRPRDYAGMRGEDKTEAVKRPRGRPKKQASDTTTVPGGE